MPKNTGYENPAAAGGAGDPPGKSKGAVGGTNPAPGKGYADPNKSDGLTHGPTIGKTGSKGQGYDDAGIGADNAKGGFSKKKSYPG